LLFPYLRRVLDSDETTCWNLLVHEPILSYHYWRFLLTKESRVMCRCWHRGCFPPHASTHELRTFLVNWVADNEWMMCCEKWRGILDCEKWRAYWIVIIGYQHKNDKIMIIIRASPNKILQQFKLLWSQRTQTLNRGTSRHASRPQNRINYSAAL